MEVRSVTMIGENSGRLRFRLPNRFIVTSCPMTSAAIRAAWFPDEETTVVVSTGARLHFGLFGVRAEAGRCYGGAGLMVDRPGTTLRVTTARHDEIVAPDSLTGRIGEWRDRFRTAAADRATGPVRIVVERALPAHRGFGSGTQTALALGTALAGVWGWGDTPVEAIARCLGRGRRSTIGTTGFATGGFLVDAGHAPLEQADRPCVTRYDLPFDWRVVLVEPLSEQGMSGEAESRAFGQLAPMPAELTDRLCRLLLLDLLPALSTARLDPFFRALAEYGRGVGRYFAPAQGDLFASPTIARLDADLTAAGQAGLVQTSWGPAAVAFAASDSDARAFAEELVSRCGPERVTATVVAPLRSGAAIRFARSGRSIAMMRDHGTGEFVRPVG